MVPHLRVIQEVLACMDRTCTEPKSPACGEISVPDAPRRGFSVCNLEREKQAGDFRNAQKRRPDLMITETPKNAMAA